METYFQGKSIVLTGGCGFIGSNMLDRLMTLNVNKITVIDDLSAGTTTNYIDRYSDTNKISFHQFDISEKTHFNEILKITKNHDILIHLAAQPSVPISVSKPKLDFDINVIGSFNLLEIARLNDINEFIFAASGGTVYGNAENFPTKENHQLRPISNYGAAKAAFEMYLSSYSSLYGIKCTSLRFGNVFGPRSLHGVMHDFFVKLKNNPRKLEILGDGNQIKSYLYIDDCIEGFLYAVTRDTIGFETFNMSGHPPISVNMIAEQISNNLKLKPKYSYTGGKTGWNGDVVRGELDSSKLKKLGWNEQVKFSEGVKNYINWLSEYYN
ncbi:MAG: UDP-glucose 4-epimerase [Candidatus Heimdallarchaeota archaeon LC_2]|nr:MAG: UDP-glucose 4-epimerase [Candidatus Heimdallarchaeota archaeon LC_2]